MTTLEKLENVAERTLESEVRLSNTYPIVETFKGQIVWDGTVDEFVDKAGRVAYAWAVRGENELQYIAVIREPPIKTPLDALRAWLVSQARK